MLDQPTYVVGHKNPDADSICSAIGYAAYKQAMGLTHFIPARCGNSNSRIDAILRRFDVTLPLFLGDVTPRVKHIMRSKPDVVQTDATCNDALTMIDELDRRALPVVDSERKLAGMITIFGLGAYFTPQINNPLDMRRVRSRISNIIRCLNARVVNVRDENEETELFIRVGAMDIRSFDRSAQENLVPAKSSIVVVGDRWDIQEKCIQLGVRLIVITGGLAVDRDIEERVKAQGISLIVSPHDTATTSWIIRTAATVDHLMEPVKYRFSADDTVASVKRRILEMNAPLFTVTDDEGILLGVFSKTDLLRPINTQLVLVDHNEMSQAVDGAREVQVIEIIDHHRLGSFTTEQPILFINEPVGSTSTIVANLFRRSGLPIPKPIAGVLMAGLIADTLHLHSPTTTEIDHEILKWLEEQSHVSPAELAELIFQSGSTLSSQTPEEVIAADCKHYHHGEVEFSVSQIEELGFDPFWDRWETIYKALDNYRSKHGLFFSTLLITDINKQNSLLLICGDSLTIEAISYPHVEKNVIFELKGVVSRKKQLIPYLTSCLKGIGITVRE